ncbi:putative addiction module antidote protein [Vibrio parahaemolyticus]|uniref:addiction module antidote protein n=1 Tax=Vibrio parahaemolyticus TaxID=670 RepID=UPI0011203115|nr:addiction module antidote protein [Vibrio parahaemolyticus]TOM63952.1 putative addiction module antidote protein [Vibrio parahaemolyticus]TOM64341.1 putative addiction module antidote protein [Vibrio parahaemolyticus]TOM69231.1 putative addiction module antidote protein [Vibrio parahaemolyticus]TOO83210.1 putative addiction module antidote protein [Vibrio parahaemolyticus]
MSYSTLQLNPFDYMETQAKINEFLNECLEDEDPAVFISALGHLVKKRGVREIADETGLSRESLYKAFNGNTQPKWNTVFKVIQALGLNLAIT